MRRTISILVLVTMALHCSSRLGLLSYLYTNRNHIAYSLGLTAEKVIAMCSKDYNQQLTLNIPDGGEAMTSGIIQAQEIILASPTTNTFTFNSDQFFEIDFTDLYRSSFYPPPLSDIFHPPSA